MASSVHPFQPYPGDGTNQPPHPSYVYAPYGTAASPPGNSLPYAYSTPPSAGYAYGAPPSAGYPVPGVPDSQGYPYGASSPAGYIPSSSMPSSYQAAPGYAAPGYAPMGAAPGYGYGANAAVYPVAGAGAPGNFGNPIGDGGGGDHNKGFADHQQQQPPVNPRDQIQIGRWAAGLCSSCDYCVPNCAMATFLPFVSLAQIYARLGLMPYRTALALFFCFYASVMLANVSSGIKSTKTTTRYLKKYTSRSSYSSSYNLAAASPPSVLALVVAGTIGQLLLRAFVWRARSVIRKRYKIPGSCYGDCCTAYWCSCCAIAQMATHVKSYTPGSCSGGAPDVLPAYTAS